jgi:hypothetical protein
MRIKIAAVLAVLALTPGVVGANDADAQTRTRTKARAARPARPIRSVIQRRVTPTPAQVSSLIGVRAPVPPPQIVRTFVIDLHDIGQEDYDRATRGGDFRLTSVGAKPRPHAHFEMRGQGDVFTGWTSGMEMPYVSNGSRRYEFVGTVGEVQPSAQAGFRRLMLKDSRLVRFYDFKDAAGKRSSIPIVRKSEISVDFPLDGQERSSVYAIPDGKNKFEYRLLTVREDVARRRQVLYVDAPAVP